MLERSQLEGRGCLTDAGDIQLNATNGRRGERHEGKEWDDANHDESLACRKQNAEKAHETKGRISKRYTNERGVMEEKDTYGKQNRASHDAAVAGRLVARIFLR